MDNFTRPESKRGRQDSYTPRWRHFHPQATLYLKNPFDEDIYFQVADEHNTPFTYKLGALARCELPGGAVATLGLKEIVDRLIGDNKTDAVRIWEPSVRERYEAQVIIRVKEPPTTGAGIGAGGTVDLSSGVDEDDLDERDDAPTSHKDEVAFPSAATGKPAAAPAPTMPPPPANRLRNKGGSGKPVDPAVAAAAAGALGSEDQEVESD